MAALRTALWTVPFRSTASPGNQGGTQSGPQPKRKVGLARALDWNPWVPHDVDLPASCQLARKKGTHLGALSMRQHTFMQLLRSGVVGLLHIDVNVDLGVRYAHTVGGCFHERVVGRVAGSERRGRIELECEPVLAGSCTSSCRIPDEAIGEVPGHGDLGGQFVQAVFDGRIKQGLVYDHRDARHAGCVQLLQRQAGIGRENKGGGDRGGHAGGSLQFSCARTRQELHRVGRHGGCGHVLGQDHLDPDLGR